MWLYNIHTFKYLNSKVISVTLEGKWKNSNVTDWPPKRSTSAVTAVTVVVVEAEAEAVAISVAVVGGIGSGANGSEICASEGAEESAAKESMLHQRWTTNGREGKERTKHIPGSKWSKWGQLLNTEVAQDSSLKQSLTHPLQEGLSMSIMCKHVEK